MGMVEPIPTLPVATVIDDTVILDTALIELTVSVEKEPVPVPGALLLILDTVRVERARKDVVILDMTMVEPNMVEPRNVEYVAIGALILVVMLRVLPVRVDKFIVVALTVARFDERNVK
jgi:hypothetical protein